MNNYLVIDNFIDNDEFLRIKNIMTSNTFPWYHTENISGNENDKDCYFIHRFFESERVFNDFLDTDDYYERVSKRFELIVPILKKINPSKLIRAKGNCYTKTSENIHHSSHVDYNFPVKGAIFYINENNGPTILDNIAEIFPKENRILFFESSLPHHSVTCTDCNVRININFNYF